MGGERNSPRNRIKRRKCTILSAICRIQEIVRQWMDKKRIENDFSNLIRIWEGKKERLGVDIKERKDGLVTQLKKQ